MNRTTDKLNRDQIIADKVAEVAEEADRVVAVVGATIWTVSQRLPDEITPEKRTPAYGIYSWEHAKEVATPAFTAVSVLFVLYLVILELFQWMLLLG